MSAMCLRATVTYRDGYQVDDTNTTGVDEDESLMLDTAASAGMLVEERPAANAAPAFAKEDYNDDLTEEDGSADNPFVRSVDENKKNVDVGGAVAATDSDTGDPVLYTLGGADAASFDIDRDSGQITTKVELDYEAQTEHMVTVTAKDPSLASTMVYVMIMVNDKDDKASLRLNNAPAFDSDMAELTVEENTPAGMAVGDAVTATDPDGDADSLTYSLDEMGEMYFDIDSATGQLMTEAPLDFEERAMYMVTVTATDTGGFMDTIDVTIMVTNVNETPVFDADMAELTVEENTPAGMAVGDAVAATDPDGDTDTLTYSLDEMGGMYFDIDSATGQLMTSAALDYEMQASYSVTVTATDSAGLYAMIAVTITVTDVPEGACAGGAAVADMTNTGLLADCDALLNIMDDLVGDGPGLDWSVDTPVDDWQGVAAGSGRVTGIFLADIGLAGTIPAEISGLSALKGLTLRDNDLIGEIPDLSALDNLEVLNLKGNSLSGSIPATLGDMASIDKLWLYSNDLTGTIPAELSRATTLRQIRLNDNGLTGEIPAELGNLPRLRYLVLSRNSLTGGIPSDLGNAVNMKQLYLYSNMLTGEIPASLGDMVDADGESVRRLQLHDNMLSGEVPASLGNLVSLENWRLGGNMLTGCIPMTLAGVSDSDMAATGLMVCTDDGS